MNAPRRPRNNRYGTTINRNYVLISIIVILVAILVKVLYSDAFDHIYWNVVNQIELNVPAQAGTTKVGESIAPFWRGCQIIFDEDNGLTQWFNDAETNSRLIDSMLEAVPLSNKADPDGRSSVDVPKMESGTEERKKNLARAKEAFRNYITLRQELLHEILTDKVLWRWYDSNERDVAFYRHMAKLSLESPPNHMQAQFEGLAATARTHTLKLIETHRNIWTEFGIGRELGKQLTMMKDYLRVALDEEVKTIELLERKSSKGHTWDSRQAKEALPRLLRRTTAVENAYLNVKAGLDQMEAILKNPPMSEPGLETDEAATITWSRAIMELLTNWGTFILSLNQGMLFASRRETLKDPMVLKNFDFHASWDDWKERNCGGTSCYEESTFRRSLRFIGYKVPSVAGRALDENAYCKKQTLEVGKRPKVWRRLYEQACCEDASFMSQFIKYAPVDTIPEVQVVA